MATRKSSTVQPRMSAQDRKWQAQSDLRTIQDAHQISKDPTRMRAVQREATLQTKALQTVIKKK